MTVPTVLFLLVGGVLSDRHDRRLRDAVGGRRARRGGRRTRRARLRRRAATSGSSWPSSRSTAAARRSSRRRSRRSSRTCSRPRTSPAANSLDQFVRPIALRLLGPAARGLARRGRRGSRLHRRRGVLRARRSWPCSRCGRAETRRRTTSSHAARCARGCSSSGGRVWLWGTLVCGSSRLPRLPRAERGAPAVRGQERAARLRRRRSASCSPRAASGPSGPRSGWASTGIRGAT